MIKKLKSINYKFYKSKTTSFILVLSVVLFLTTSCSNIGLSTVQTVSDKVMHKLNKDLTPHVPSGISVILNERYEPEDINSLLDIYYPEVTQPLEKFPVVIWIHGGSWVSGSKDYIANYAKILASNGYVVAVVDYTLAPMQYHPYQAIQINKALAFLTENAERFFIDTEKMFLAGDSAGANLCAQLTNAIYLPSYAGLINITPSLTSAQLRGVILQCGPYDINLFDIDGFLSGFIKLIGKTYSGEDDFLNEPSFQPASVAQYVTADFPPAFISAGNNDPLESQSIALAQQLDSLGVYVDTLFFPKDYRPKLPHEYQFNLDGEAGKLALERTIVFLQKQCNVE